MFGQKQTTPVGDGTGLDELHYSLSFFIIVWVFWFSVLYMVQNCDLLSYSFDIIRVLILCLSSVTTNHTYVHFHLCQSTVRSATFSTKRVIKWSVAKWGWGHRRIFPDLRTWVTKVAADGFFAPMHCEQWTNLMVMFKDLNDDCSIQYHWYEMMSFYSV